MIQESLNYFNHDGLVTWYWHIRVMQAIKLFNSLTWNFLTEDDFYFSDKTKRDLLEILNSTEWWDNLLKHTIVLDSWEVIQFGDYINILLAKQWDKIEFLFHNIDLLSNWFVVFWQWFFSVYFIESEALVSKISVESFKKLFEKIYIYYKDTPVNRFLVFQKIYLWYLTWLQSSISTEKFFDVNNNFFWEDINKNNNIDYCSLNMFLSHLFELKFFEILYPYIQRSLSDLLNSLEYKFFNDLSNIWKLSENNNNTSDYMNILKNFSESFWQIYYNNQLNHLISTDLWDFFDSIFARLLYYQFFLWIDIWLIINFVFSLLNVSEFKPFKSNIERLIMSDQFVSLNAEYLISLLENNDICTFQNFLMIHLSKRLPANIKDKFFNNLFSIEVLQDSIFLSLEKLWLYDSIVICIKIYLSNSYVDEDNYLFSEISVRLFYLINNLDLLASPLFHNILNHLKLLADKLKVEKDYVRYNFICNMFIKISKNKSIDIEPINFLRI